MYFIEFLTAFDDIQRNLPGNKSCNPLISSALFKCLTEKQCYKIQRRYLQMIEDNGKETYIIHTYLISWFLLKRPGLVSLQRVYRGLIFHSPSCQ